MGCQGSTAKNPMVESSIHHGSTATGSGDGGSGGSSVMRVTIQPSLTPPNPKPSATPQNVKTMQNMDKSIFGKPFEDIKKFYTLGKKLGSGKFGIVYLCTENSSGIKYACKSILKRNLKSEDDREDIRREIQILQHLSGQPNIVEFKGAYEDRCSVNIVMEHCDGGELFDQIIAQPRGFSERDAASICRVIVKVVHICHLMGVMHRDLKPENFLISFKAKGAVLKAIDFGLSVFIEEGKIYHDAVGSAYYVAPEVLRHSYGKEIDIWSAGSILYILLSGVQPFWGEDTLEIVFDAILKDELDFVREPWPSISDSAKDLVRKMLTRDPKKRITSSQILEHPWMKVDGEASDNEVARARER